MKQRLTLSFLALTLLAAGLAPPAAAAEPLPRNEQEFRSRLASVRTMAEGVQRESARTGADNEALLSQIAARTREAEGLAAVGEFDAARSVLDAGYRNLTAAMAKLMKNGAAGLGGKALSEARRRELIEREINSTNALIGALKRQNAEKSGGKDTELGALEQETADATAALKAGDTTRAEALIHDAYPRLKAAIASLQTASDLKTGSAALEARREEASGQVEEAVRGAYARRRDSVIALIETGRRIAGEKSTARPEFARADTLLVEAETLAAAGRFVDGKSRLDQAYLLAKDAVRSMRSGEELTADKKFASKADEFKYEQARNDDYQGLIASVIHGQTDASWAQAAEKARSLRRDAEAIGNSGDFEAALRKIDESTNALKGILRRAGFPII